MTNRLDLLIANTSWEMESCPPAKYSSFHRPASIRWLHDCLNIEIPSGLIHQHASSSDINLRSDRFQDLGLGFTTNCMVLIDNHTYNAVSAVSQTICFTSFSEAWSPSSGRFWGSRPGRSPRWRLAPCLLRRGNTPAAARRVRSTRSCDNRSCSSGSGPVVDPGLGTRRRRG